MWLQAEKFGAPSENRTHFSVVIELDKNVKHYTTSKCLTDFLSMALLWHKAERVEHRVRMEHTTQSQ